MPRLPAADVEKYSLAKVEYERSFPRDTSRLDKADYFRDLLSWALENGSPGFEVGDDIGIAAAASGFGASRTTVAKAVQQLVNTGQLIAQTKSPYRVAGKLPVISADALPGKSFSPQIAVQDDVGDLVAPLEQLVSGSDESHDILEYFRATRGEIESRFGILPAPEDEARPKTHLVRARFHWGGGANSVPTIWWLESTLINLPADHTDALEKAIAECRRNKRKFFSLYTNLYNLDVDPDRQIQKDSIFTDDDLVHSSKAPGFLRARAEELLKSPYLQMPAAQVSDETMIRLSFRLQAPPPAAVFGISAVFLHIPPGFPVPFVVERFRFRDKKRHD
jgi:biotin operon repressor